MLIILFLVSLSKRRDTMPEINLETIEKMIHIIRGQKVMLDQDLGKLYEVEAKRINEQVRRNSERFPRDFMFQLTQEEFNQINFNSSQEKITYGGKRKLPYAFTENGVAMLSSVLNSSKAIQVNIAIMRIFTKLRSFLFLEKNLNERIDLLESDTNKTFRTVFENLEEVHKKLEPHLPTRRKKIGFHKN